MRRNNRRGAPVQHHARSLAIEQRPAQTDTAWNRADTASRVLGALGGAGLAAMAACGTSPGPGAVATNGDAGSGGSGADATIAPGGDASASGSSATGSSGGASASGTGSGSGSGVGSGNGASDAGSGDDGGVTTGADATSPPACTAVGVPVPAAERISNGHPVLPPKWAFGVLWGSYYDQVGPPVVTGSVGNLLSAASQLRTDGYGGDLMWIDSSWLYHTYGSSATDPVVGPRYVCFQFDPVTFPDPATMIGTLQKEHFHFGVWEWPWMGHGCQYFQAGITNKYFVMNGSNPALATGGWHGDPTPAAFDFTSASAVTWWKGLNQPLANWGLDFMKLDTGGDAPAGGALADSTKVYRTEYHRAAFDVTRSYAETNNLDAKMNAGRGFILAHTSPTATNDQLPGMWTDDTDATWAGFANQDLLRAAGLNTPTSAAFWCGDTGGYGLGTASPTDELYIRWLEYSSFTPCQEIFGSKSVGSRFPWRFSAQAQTVAKQYTALRYRLLPFRYSNAQIAYHETPVKYPVTFIGTKQILVGSGQSQILVQPVTTQGATTVAVPLPAGSPWINYWTGAIYPGGTSPTVAAPIDQEPVLVKAGSIIPMGPPIHWVDEVPADPLTLDIYPGGATSYTLYEDDGISQGYLGGAYSTTKLSADDTTGHVVVSIGAQVTAKYAYSGQLCARTYILKVNQAQAAPAAVTRDGSPLPASSQAAFGGALEGWYYDAAAKITWVKLRLSSNVATQVTL